MNEELWRLTLEYINGRQGESGRSLRELVEAHPEHAAELIEFATQHFVLEGSGGEHDAAAESLELARNALDAHFAKLRYRPTLTSLLGRAQQRGYDLEKLAQSIGVGKDIVQKLDARALEITSLPAVLIEGLVRLLGVSRPQLLDYLEGSREDAPAVRESFAMAVRASPMSVTEQTRWLERVATEKAPSTTLPTIPDAAPDTVLLGGPAFRDARKRAKLSLQSVAAAASNQGHTVDIPALFALETSMARPFSPSLATVLAAVLQVPLSELVIQDVRPASSPVQRALQSATFQDRVRTWARDHGRAFNDVMKQLSVQAQGAAFRSQNPSDQEIQAMLMEVLESSLL